MRRRFETRLVHAGEPRPRIRGAVTLPIFQSATYEYGGGGDVDYHDVRYLRLNNSPNHEALHEKLAALESAEAALVTASGMAAISTSLLTLLGAGDHALFQSCLYGGTYDLVTVDLPRLGIEIDFIDADRAESWRERLRPNTRVIYVETITNPLIEVGDLAAVPAFAREHGLVSIVDNTFASSYNFRPAEHGFDLSLHSCTKYMNGHSDIVAGAAIGSQELITRLRHKLNHTGATLDPHACFLLNRGLKTLALRVGQQNRSALELAGVLDKHAAVEQVNYAGLPSHPRHGRARQLLDGFGGMLSFELRGGAEAAERFMKRLTIPILAPSLGGVETLVTVPAQTSHRGLSAGDREKMGIGDGLMRVSVGIEATEDLVEDFSRALEGC